MVARKRVKADGSQSKVVGSNTVINKCKIIDKVPHKLLKIIPSPEIPRVRFCSCGFDC